MRLVSFLSENDEQHVGLHLKDRILDLSIWLSQGAAGSGSSLDMLHLIEMGEAGLDMCREALTESEDRLEAMGALTPLHPARLLAPIPRPRKNVMCLGRNYAEHRDESMPTCRSTSRSVSSLIGKAKWGSWLQSAART
jgi:2-keto-4-pentenoate hydratase/2-oxohepta-3-ene-1,7-dioic acid hydratase in catechol pathway